MNLIQDFIAAVIIDFQNRCIAQIEGPPQNQELYEKQCKLIFEMLDVSDEALCNGGYDPSDWGPWIDIGGLTYPRKVDNACLCKV